MFKSFGDIFVAFIFSAAVGGLAALLGVATITSSYGWSVVGLIVWFIISWIIFERVARRRLLRLNNLLAECKISEYVDAYDKIEKRAHGTEGKRMTHINKARGLLYFGAIDEALEDLSRIDIAEKHRFKEMHLTALLNMIFFNAYIEKGDVERALKSLSVCKYMVQDRLYSEPFLSSMKELIKRADARLALAEGEFDGMEEVYQELLMNSAATVDKVVCHYRLAEIAEHFGNEEDRTEHLEYVSDKGGTTIYKYFADLALAGGPVMDKAIYNGDMDVEDMDVMEE